MARQKRGIVTVQVTIILMIASALAAAGGAMLYSEMLYKEKIQNINHNSTIINKPVVTPSPSPSPTPQLKPPETLPPKPSRPPVLENNVTTVKDALIDLKNIGCSVTNVTEIMSGSQGIGMSLSYSEFREFAYKKEAVFWYSSGGQNVLISNSDNVLVAWVEPKPEPKIIETASIIDYWCTSASTGWVVSVKIENMGVHDVNITKVIVNDEKVPDANYYAPEVVPNSIGTDILPGFIIKPRTIREIHVFISESYKSVKSGTLIKVGLESESGKNYEKIVQLTALTIKVEKIEITNTVFSPSIDSTGTKWTGYLSLKNTGTSEAILSSICVNNTEIIESEALSPSQGNAVWYAYTKIIPIGGSTTVQVVLRNRGDNKPFTNLSSGTTINLSLRSIGGINYQKIVMLP